MQNWVRSEFDEQWKDTFAKAEVAPSQMVWTNLDRELTLADSDEDKRRIAFYQRVAAACVLFALLTGSFGVYYWKQSSDHLAQINSASELGNKVQPNQTSDGKDSQASKNEIENNSSIENKNQSRGSTMDSANQTSNETLDGLMSQKKLAVERTQSTIPTVKAKQNKNDVWLAIDTTLPPLELLPIADIHGEPHYVEIVRKLPRISSAFMNDNKKEKFNHEKLWASVSASSGTYSESSGGTSNLFNASGFFSHTASQSSSPPSSSLTSPSGSSNSVGRIYSYGVIGGVRIAERWVLQTGVQYLNQTIASSNLNTAQYSSTGSFVTTNEFVSVPVQAGYLLIDRKIGLQVNPGLATDFFVKNTISNQQQSVSQGAGEDSPYRSVNFAGLMSSEVSYKLGRSYRLSLVPGLRYSFNSILKSQTEGTAISWDVAFRFRYIFK